MRRATERAARIQGGAIAIAAIAIVALLVAASKRPYDRDTLAVEVEALRSYASEARALAGARIDDDVAAHFAREHAAQLLEKVRDERSALRHRPPKAFMGGTHDQAKSLADALVAALEPMVDDASSASRQRPVLAGVFDRLDALSKQLKPGG